LTVCDHDQQGLFGGYLVLNVTGRPVEFHCTAPVRVSRAQEILYGATLKPYLYGEQIGQALLDKANITPLVVFTDDDTVLSVRPFTDSPVACVLPPAAQDAPDPVPGETFLARVDAAHPRLGAPFADRLHAFVLGGHRLAVSEPHAQDVQTITQRWQAYADSFDLHEPFGRIREAIDEARRSTR
jgi:hypothetical protein